MRFFGRLLSYICALIEELMVLASFLGYPGPSFLFSVFFFSRLLREQWIRAKYERKEFIHSEKQEPYSAGSARQFGRDVQHLPFSSPVSVCSLCWLLPMWVSKWCSARDPSWHSLYFIWNIGNLDTWWKTNQISSFCCLAAHQEQVRPSSTGFVSGSRSCGAGWEIKDVWMLVSSRWLFLGVSPTPQALSLPVHRAVAPALAVAQCSALGMLVWQSSSQSPPQQGDRGTARAGMAEHWAGWFPCRRAGFEEETQCLLCGCTSLKVQEISWVFLCYM